MDTTYVDLAALQTQGWKLLHGAKYVQFAVSAGDPQDTVVVTHAILSNDTTAVHLHSEAWPSLPLEPWYDRALRHETPMLPFYLLMGIAIGWWLCRCAHRQPKEE